MIAYNTDFPEGVKPNLNELEPKFAEVLEKLLAVKKYAGLTATTSLSVEKANPGDDKYELAHNATLSLQNSNALVADIDDFFRRNEKWLAGRLVPTAKLKVTLTLAEAKEADKKRSGEAKDEAQTFLPTKPRYSFDQVILPEALKNEIFEALNIISYQDLIYKDWGFDAVDPIPKSVLNFYGPPGTGKTMCAHAIAKHVDRPLLALNYAEIESKYVGEAPKNLMKAFEVARKENCVLFFDEADSFLGKRIQNVTQGSDQALNSLRSQMLILLEEFSGIVIFATNLVTNFDKAFESRILKHLKFELPNQEARTAIVRSMIPKRLPIATPFTEEDYTKFGEVTDGLAGREMKGAVLEALLTKASKEGTNAVFTAQDFVDAFEKRQEMLKKLKEEEEREKKEKILKALARKKNAEAEAEAEAEEAEKDEAGKAEAEKSNADESADASNTATEGNDAAKDKDNSTD